MDKIIQVVSIFTASLLFSAVSNAEFYKWTDDKGNVHFTDTPPKGKKVEELELKINTYSAVEIIPLVERLGRKDKVVMYSATWCGICKKAKRYFKAKKIPYVVYDVEKSYSGKRDFKLLKGKSVPIIIVGDKRMNGFTVARFDKLYQQQMLKRDVEAKPKL
jgi:glutaredoxin